MAPGLRNAVFDIFVRDDGLWGIGPDGAYDEQVSAYNQYLHSKGYEGENPWHDFANAGVDADGDIASGWLYNNMRIYQPIYAKKILKRRGLRRETIEFLKQKKAENSRRPWMCHVILYQAALAIYCPSALS